jgi:hypothetical protein
LTRLIDYSDIPPLSDEFFSHARRGQPAVSDETDDEATEYGRYTPEHEPSDKDELYYIILKLVQDECYRHPDAFDSWGISTYERAIKALEQAGFVEIDESCGRITARPLPRAHNFEKWMDYHERRERIRRARDRLATVPGATAESVARIYNITLEDLDDAPEPPVTRPPADPA